ncbi:MAG: helix-turn-helix domain-containing protein [Bacteroidota bacterium]
MRVTNIDSQGLTLREKVKNFFLRSVPHGRVGMCPTKDVFAVTTDKWSLFCLYNLAYHGRMRFGALQKKIPGISARMLSVTLKRLESHHMVARTMYAEIPPRVEYELTEFGKGMSEQLIEISTWMMDQHPFYQNATDRSTP